jgi:hypothetical protein
MYVPSLIRPSRGLTRAGGTFAVKCKPCCDRANNPGDPSKPPRNALDDPTHGKICQKSYLVSFGKKLGGHLTTVGHEKAVADMLQREGGRGIYDKFMEEAYKQRGRAINVARSFVFMNASPSHGPEMYNLLVRLNAIKDIDDENEKNESMYFNKSGLPRALFAYSEILQQEQMKRILAADYKSLMWDEGTDVSGGHNIIVYVRYTTRMWVTIADTRHELLVPLTEFLALQKVKGRTAKDIHAAVKEVAEEFGIDVEKDPKNVNQVREGGGGRDVRSCQNFALTSGLFPHTEST